jgi:hypothetical protein
LLLSIDNHTVYLTENYRIRLPFLITFETGIKINNDNTAEIPATGEDYSYAGAEIAGAFAVCFKAFAILQRAV